MEVTLGAIAPAAREITKRSWIANGACRRVGRPCARPSNSWRLPALVAGGAGGQAEWNVEQGRRPERQPGGRGSPTVPMAGSGGVPVKRDQQSATVPVVRGSRFKPWFKASLRPWEEEAQTALVETAAGARRCSITWRRLGGPDRPSGRWSLSLPGQRADSRAAVIASGNGFVQLVAMVKSGRSLNPVSSPSTFSDTGEKKLSISVVTLPIRKMRHR